MKIEYSRWWSPALSQDMELKVYGYYGKPILVFPAQGGRFYEYEDFKMIEAVSDFIESGKVKIITVDSIDNQSWANWNAHPADRARRHQDYDAYIINEVIPFIHQSCGNDSTGIITTGCSMGAYHSLNFYFRHPEVFDTVIALSGLYRLNTFIGYYLDDNVYFNSPIHYLLNLQDDWYLQRYRQGKIIICTGQGAWEDECVADTRTIQHILEAKGIPCWVDYWGHDVNHDWPWWRKMMPYYLDKLNLSGWC
jgi:esterase/lipase superfamily enzyme